MHSSTIHWLSRGAIATFIVLGSVNAWAVTAPSFAAPVQYTSGGQTIVKIVSTLRTPALDANNVDTGADTITYLDINNDGTAGDFVTADHDTKLVRVHLAPAGGGSAYVNYDITAGSAPTDLAVADVNADGLPDIITCENGCIVVYLNTTAAGTVSFGSGTSFTGNDENAGMLAINKVAIADVDNDGLPDLIGVGTLGLPSFSSRVQVVVFRNTTANHVLSFAASVVYGGMQASGDYVVAANLTRNAPGGAIDSFPEIIVGSNRGDFSNGNVSGGSGFGTYSVFLNKGDGTYGSDDDSTPSARPIHVTTYDHINGLAVGDVNADGNRDLLLEEGQINGGGQTFIQLFPGNGDGSFGANGQATSTQLVTVNPTGTIFQGDVVLGDFNGDGTIDVAVTDPLTTHGIIIFALDPTAAPSVFFPSSFGSNPGYLTIATGAGAQAIGVTDSNGDGLPDLFVANNDANNLSLLVNKGTTLTLQFSATGPTADGGPIHFTAAIETGWSVRVQEVTVANPKEYDWTDLNDGNGGHMTESPAGSGNFVLDSAAYPAGLGVSFRAIAAKTGQTDVISAPLSNYTLHQAALSIAASLTSTSDFAHGRTAYVDDYLIYKLTFKNSGDAPAKALRVSAKVPTFLSADIPLLVKTTAGSTSVTLASGDTSTLSLGGSFASGPGLGGTVVGNTDGSHVYIPLSATITAIPDATHFVISVPATTTSGTKTVSALVQYASRSVQFAQGDISLSPGGSYVPETTPGAGDARLQWDVGDLPGAAGFIYSQYVTFAVHLSGKVRTDQGVGIGTDYSVFSTGTPPQPGIGSNGYLSQSPPVSCRINGNISFLLNPLATTVAPGGYLTYVFSLTNRGVVAATNPVAVVDVPQNTRFAATYANGTKGVVFVGSGVLTSKLVYPTATLAQVALKFPSIPAKTTVQVKVTFQVKWTSPVDVPTISSIDYGAAFLNPAAVSQFNTLFNAASSLPAAQLGTSQTITTDTVLKAAIPLATPNFTVNSAFGQAPLAVTFVNTTTDLVRSWKWDFGDGVTSALQTPSHTYATPGVYAVSLTATNAGGSRKVTQTNAVDATTADFFALVSDPSNKIARSANQSGAVSVTVNGPLDAAPLLNVFKLVSDSLAKTEDDGTGTGTRIDLVKPGDQLNFILMLTNTGSSAAEEVYVQDAMPDNTTYVSSALMATGTVSKTKSMLLTIQDPDHHHLVFSGLHLEPNDSLCVLLTLSVNSSLIVPPATDPPLYLAVGDCSIGSGSTTSTPVGIVPAKLIKVIGDVKYAQPRLTRLISVPVASTNVSTTKAALDTLYAKTPSAVPLTNPKDLLSYIPGVQRFYVHYENIGNAGSTGFKLTVPLPVNTAFYRASWVTLASNASPGGGPLPPGTIAKPPAGGTISKPAVLATSGNIIFNLPTLAAAGKGDVIVEVVVLPSAIMQAGSYIGDPSQTISIDDAGGNFADLSLKEMKVLGTAASAGVSSLASFHREGLFTLTSSNAVPSLGFIRYVSKSHVVPGETFTITLVAFNFGETTTKPSLGFTIPANCTLISADAGGSQIILPADNNPGSYVFAVIATNNGPVSPDADSMYPHSAGALTLTLQATGIAGTDITDWTSQAGAPYHIPVPADPATIHIVAPGSPALKQRQSAVESWGRSFTFLTNGTKLIDLGGGSSITQGDSSLISLGTGIIISQNDSNIIATADPNLIAVQTPGPSGTLLPPAKLMANNGYLATSGKLGNQIVIDENALISSTAGGIVAQGGGNIVAQGGGNIVAQGGGNIVAQGGGNIVAQGGGNIVAQGGGNVIAGTGGNIVAQGGGNIVAQGGGNIVAQGGGNIVAQGGGN